MRICSSKWAHSYFANESFITLFSEDIVTFTAHYGLKGNRHAKVAADLFFIRNFKLEVCASHGPAKPAFKL